MLPWICGWQEGLWSRLLIDTSGRLLCLWGSFDSPHSGLVYLVCLLLYTVLWNACHQLLWSTVFSPHFLVVFIRVWKGRGTWEHCFCVPDLVQSQLLYSSSSFLCEQCPHMEYLHVFLQSSVCPQDPGHTWSGSVFSSLPVWVQRLCGVLDVHYQIEDISSCFPWHWKFLLWRSVECCHMPIAFLPSDSGWITVILTVRHSSFPRLNTPWSHCSFPCSLGPFAGTSACDILLCLPLQPCLLSGLGVSHTAL